MAEAPTYRQPLHSMARWSLLGLTALLASCAGMVPKGRPGPATPPPATEAPVESGFPGDKARHRVALLVPLSGPNAAVGQSIANAATMALIDTGNKSVRMTTYDTAAGAAAAANRAVADGNRLFLGPLLSEDAAAVAPAARKAGIPVVSYSNDAAVAGNGVFVMGFSPTQSIDRVVHFARSKGIKRFAALVPVGVYGRNASTAVIRSVENADANLVAMKSYERNSKSLQKAIADLGRSQAYEGVLIADNARLAISAVPLIRKISSQQARVLGTELWAAEPSALTAPALNGAWYASVSDSRYRQLAASYRRQFGKAPFRLASLGYDSMLLVVKIARDWKVGERFPADRLRDEDGFVGVDGAFRFGPTGVAQRALEVGEATPSGVKTVSPAPSSFKE
ncbi:ABC-type branched-chain amino acid transport systems periplasmic component-like protein [Rhizorhabdus wittichii RW1]|uniref:ABC-type branched-chain amino acid transport systems periplasmic component-like protein n=1 Tax=Rhizorhabdus wittichii (strain DSM 6014 / CCUG 31198 / JCM 15750 / NBRC 105917 / EY 4224 / RW1) TaxID=392499 RepID=A0A9J9H8L8_RHIWR|nr:ABC-type branched-chain amino acid transport systems periplasmic component-like protein [Rhizorhabdus wittichii RW1]